MSSSKSHVQYLAVMLVLSVYLIEQASARICYVCDSDIDSDCINYANQNKFARLCAPTDNWNNSVPIPSNGTQNFIGTRQLYYDCATAVGISTIDGRSRIVRGCAIPTVTCGTYQIIYAAKFNLQVNKCLRCNADYCNFRNY